MPRKDLAKVLVERERLGSKNKFHNFRSKLKQAFLKDPDGATGLLTKGRIYGWNNKNLNENLSPLRGFLRKAVGKKWDDVYSDLCSLLDKRSVVNQHVFDHLFQYVAVNIIPTDHGYYVASKYSGIVPLEHSSYSYFVDHEKILRKVGGKTYRQSAAEWKRKEAEKLAKTYRKINDTSAYVKVDDVWYLVTYLNVLCKRFFKKVESKLDPRRSTDVAYWRASSSPYLFDVIKKETLPYDVSSLIPYDDDSRKKGIAYIKVAVKKKQLSSVEIRRAGL